jgi:pimeloyl-CoA synthetase
LQSLLSLQAVDDDANLSSEAVKNQKQGLSQERFEKALESIKSGSVSKQAVMFKFELTKEQLTKLNEL